MATLIAAVCGLVLLLLLVGLFAIRRTPEEQAECDAEEVAEAEAAAEAAAEARVRARMARLTAALDAIEDEQRRERDS